MTLLIINRNDLQWTTGAGRYVTTPPSDRLLLTRMFGGGLNGWSTTDYHRTQVVQMLDLEHVYRVARWTADRFGVTRILALHEKDQLAAARVRDDLAIPGPKVQDVLPYRDKYLMKCLARDAGIPVPQFALGTEPRPGWLGPSVTKDRWGLGADSIRWWETPQEAVRGLVQAGPAADQTLIEERVYGEMYYCDAIVVDGETIFASVSQYIVEPGEYLEFDWQADISPVRPDIEHDITKLNERVLDALGRHDGVFHGEYFRDSEGALRFCEIAARPGGGGVDLLVRHTTGVDLIEAAVAFAEGRRPTIDRDAPRGANILLGLYPSPNAEPLPNLEGDLEGVAYHEIVSHGHMDIPRHANDYTDMLMLHGSTRDDVLELMDQVLRRSGRQSR